MYGEQDVRMYTVDDYCMYTVDVLCVYVMSGPQYQQTGPDDVKYHRGHKLALTCVAVDDKHIFTGSKDCSIVKCELVFRIHSHRPCACRPALCDNGKTSTVNSC